MLIDKNLDHARLQTQVKLLQEELEGERSRSGIIGKSTSLRRALETAEKLAQGENTTVLIEGESGTGKELMARFVHQQSSRRDKPFVTLNCGAIPKELAESEFFGYEKGAFTGATEKMKQGKFELADGGTILLDEIRELSLDMQVKLLRVLEEKRFYRLGGTKEISVDVRVIAASNKELAREVEEGRFREDLYYRLNVASVRIPPLRNRKEDISELAKAFLAEFCRRFNRSGAGHVARSTAVARTAPVERECPRTAQCDGTRRPAEQCAVADGGTFQFPPLHRATRSRRRPATGRRSCWISRRRGSG